MFIQRKALPNSALSFIVYSLNFSMTSKP